MPNTPYIAMWIGVVLAALYGFVLLKPSAAHNGLMAWPRARIPAVILTVVAVAWFAHNLWFVDFGRFSEPLRIALLVGVPVCSFLIITFIPDLLAVRGLCALMLLAGNPLLVQTRWHGSAAQWAIGLLVYAVMIKAMILVVYPHLWKRGVSWAFAQTSRTRALAASGMGLGVLFLVLGGIAR